MWLFFLNFIRASRQRGGQAVAIFNLHPCISGYYLNYIRALVAISKLHPCISGYFF